MIITCTCGSGLRVSGDPEEIRLLIGEKSDWWPDKYPCFSCGEMATGMLESEADEKAAQLIRFVNVKAQEAYAALCGMGVPEERTCCAEVIEALFKEHGIKAKGRQPRAENLYYVDELEFKDGTRLFLAPSPRGAAIFRVAKPHSYTKEALENV